MIRAGEVSGHPCYHGVLLYIQIIIIVIWTTPALWGFTETLLYYYSVVVYYYYYSVVVKYRHPLL